MSIGTALIILAISTKPTEASILKLIPGTKNIGVGQEAVLNIIIDTEDVSINATQATLYFPPAVLQVIGVDKAGSVFNFWVEEPTFSNDAGTVNFIGGTSKGVSGSSLQILKVRFKTVGAGTANLSVSDAAITASDGKGTNVLETTHGATIQVGVSGAILSPPTPSSPEVEQPQKVVREAVRSTGLPEKPKIRVPLYPDEARWYNLIGEATAFWELPSDVIQVEAKIGKGRDTAPGTPDPELFTGKNFGVLSEGIWYARVRLRNNIGWSSFAFYKISLDTSAPSSFEINLEQDAPDDPAPDISYESSDSISGIAEYRIFLDEQEVLRTASSSLALPLQPPGKHRLLIRAMDLAGNSVEDNLEFEILPIASPTITFITKELFSDEAKGLAVKGTALPNSNNYLYLRVDQSLISQKTVRSDEKGNWEFTFDQAFKNGNYKVTAQSQDARGALSLVVESPLIKVKSKPIIQIGILQLGMGGAALSLLFILIVSFGGGVWFYKKRQEKLAMRVSFTESEIAKIFQLIRADIERLSKTRETPTTGDDEYAMKQLRENIQKMEAYLKRGVEKIKK